MAEGVKERDNKSWSQIDNQSYVSSEGWNENVTSVSKLPRSKRQKSSPKLNRIWAIWFVCLLDSVVSPEWCVTIIAAAKGLLNGWWYGMVRMSTAWGGLWIGGTPSWASQYMFGMLHCERTGSWRGFQAYTRYTPKKSALVVKGSRGDS